MANSSTQGNVTQATGHAHSSTNTALKYRSTNSGQPLAHADVDDNFEILRLAINGIVSDIDTVVQTDVPAGAVFTDTTYSDVTDTVSGLMTGAMKQKLDGIAEGAEENVQVDWNQTASDADDFIKNKPNIAYTSAIQPATQSADGLMSLADKTKLDGIQAGATAGGGGGASVTTDVTAPTNPLDGDLWFNENEAELYVYTASLGAWIQTNGGGSGGGEAYDSGWITCSPSADGLGEYMDFTHFLGEQPNNITVLLSGNSSGTDAWEADLILDANNNNMYGYSVAEIGSSTMRIWMSAYGVLEYKGRAWSGDPSSNGATVHQWGSGNAAYVRVIATVGAGGGGVGTYQRWSTDGNWRGGAIVLDDQYHGSHWYEESDIHAITAIDINTGQNLGQVGPPDRSYYMPNPSLTNGGNWGVSGTATSYPFNDAHAAWMAPEIFNVTNNDGTHKNISSSIDVLWIGGNAATYGYLQTFNRTTKASTWQTLGAVGGSDVFELVATIPTNNAWPPISLF